MLTVSSGRPLTCLAIRPIPRQFNNPLMLDGNQSIPGKRENHERDRWMEQRSDNGKESKDCRRAGRMSSGRVSFTQHAAWVRVHG